MLRFPPRVVSILCAVQTLVIILGYMITKSMNKIYASHEYLQQYKTVPLPARIVLSMGPWLLLIPFVWALIATAKANIDGGIAEITRTQACVGYVLLAAIILLCLLSTIGHVNTVFGPIH